MRLDTRPLTARVDRQAREQLRRRYPERKRLPDLRSLYYAVLPVLWIASVMSITASEGSHAKAPPAWILGSLFIGLHLKRVLPFFRTSDRRRCRLKGFADANGFWYDITRHSPDYPGMIFARSSWGESEIRDRFERRSGPTLDIGDHQRRKLPFLAARVHRWGYVMMRLPVPLPHIVLDSRRNNSLFHSDLPEAVGRHQRVSLEGDFDRHFTLYCPVGAERDALYLFTPDVMARFIDTAAGLDVEIVDDHLFLYSPGGIITTDPAAWERLMETVEAVEEKVARWGRWRGSPMRETADAEDGVGSPRAAITAPRLRTHPHVWYQATWLVVIVTCVVWFLSAPR
ncbi:MULTISPECIES: hypothetical protein [unclassified Clavibacter]|uniref:hypothetical protein n=1 Tax=unclassified Clavibacter TaxID=2626594 RepID=UPI0039E1CE44